jgi:DUF971 family protein
MMTGLREAEHSSLTAIELFVPSARHVLCVTWADASTTQVSAARLRVECRSSRAIRARLDGIGDERSEDIRIEAVEPIGLYGVTIRFSDGHDRGIYPWALLRQLGDADGRVRS